MRILEVKSIPLAIALKKLVECERKGLIVKGLAKRTMELAEVLSKCSSPGELYEELIRLGLNDLTASMIVDVTPKNQDEVKILLNFESSNIDNEVISKIVDLVSKYCYRDS
ncbi:MAG: hypothetical protein QXG17_02665 [Sulfolobales archaeon]